MNVLIYCNEHVFECRGRDRGYCSKCQLRFRCLTEDKTVVLSDKEAEKIVDLKSLSHYLFNKKMPYYQKEFGEIINGKRRKSPV